MLLDLTLGLALAALPQADPPAADKKPPAPPPAAERASPPPSPDKAPPPPPVERGSPLPSPDKAPPPPPQELPAPPATDEAAAPALADPSKEPKVEFDDGPAPRPGDRGPPKEAPRERPRRGGGPPGADPAAEPVPPPYPTGPGAPGGPGFPAAQNAPPPRDPGARDEPDEARDRVTKRRDPVQRRSPDELPRGQERFTDRLPPVAEDRVRGRRADDGRVPDRDPGPREMERIPGMGMPGRGGMPGGGDVAPPRGRGMLGGPMLPGADRMPEDPQTVRFIREEEELEKNSFRLAQSVRSAQGGERERQMKQLGDTLTKLFEVRQNRRKMELEHLMQQVERLRRSVDAREQRKGDLVQKKLREMIGEGDDIGFD
jgi:hypothetical protein